MVEASPLGIVMLDLDTLRVEEFNQAYADMLGYDKEELKGLPLSQLTHPDDLQVDAEFFKENVNRLDESFELEKRYLRRDGKTIWARVRTAGLKSEDGHSYSVGLIEDVTEKREQQIRLKLLESVAKFSQDAICIVHVLPGGRKEAVYVNPTFSELTGWTAEEILGSHCQLCKASGEAAALMGKTIKELTPHKGEFLLKKKDGRVARFSCERLTMEQIPDKVIAFSDIETHETSIVIGLSEETKDSIQSSNNESLEDVAKESGLKETSPGIYE